MAAITGLTVCSRCPRRSCRSKSHSSLMPPSCEPPCIFLRSAPAQNALSPAPVRIATRSAGSRSNSRSRSPMRRAVSRSKAFIASGRLIVMRAMLPFVSYRILLTASPLFQPPLVPLLVDLVEIGTPPVAAQQEPLLDVVRIRGEQRPQLGIDERHRLGVRRPEGDVLRQLRLRPGLQRPVDELHRVVGVGRALGHHPRLVREGRALVADAD